MRCALLLFVGCGLIALLVSAPVFGQPVDTLFAEGNRHYQAGDVEAALAAYQQIVNRGTTSGALYFNMGNAYFRLGATGQAIRHYEKARRWGADATRLRHNLAIAYERLPGAAEPPPRHPVWERAAATVGTTPVFIAGLALLLISLAVGVYDRWDGPPLAQRTLTYGTAAVAGVLLFTAFGASYLQTQAPRAVVLPDRAPLHARPTANAPADTTLPEGAIVEVQRNAPDWTRIRLPNGRTGWMPTPALGDI